MKKARLRGLVVAATTATLLLTACGGGEPVTSSNNAPGGKAGTQALTIGMPNGSQTNNSNPFVPTSAAKSMGYASVIYEPLAQINTTKPENKPTPWLAKDWTWNKDYTQVTVTARDGVKWSDGKPFTAEDIAYSVQLRMKNSALNSEGLPYKSVTQSGDKVTVTFTANQFVNNQKFINLIIVPKHIWQSIKDPSTDLNQKPVGTGPYVLDTWTNQGVTLKANKSYWGTKPQVQTLRYTSYNDNNSLTTALANGDVQWGWTFIANYKKVYVSKDPANNKVWYPTNLGADVLYVNTTKAPFNDAAVRKAVSQVVDRKAISTQASQGVYPAITSITGLPTPAGDPFIAPQFKDKTLAGDVSSAKKLLTDAGYKYSGDKLLGKDGKPVTVTLTDPAGWSDYLTALQVMSQNMKSIGITAKVEAPNADSWTNNMGNGNFDAALHWSDSGATPWNTYASMMGGTYYKPLGQNATYNFGRYKSADADKALDGYANATTEKARTEALAEIQKVFSRDMPAIPSTARPSLAEYSVKNYVGWPDDSNPYATPDPTLSSAAQIILKLKPKA